MGILPSLSYQNLNVAKVRVKIMNMKSRIPGLNTVFLGGAVQWFTEMANHGLLFHLDDDPADIVVIKMGEPVFSNEEADSARLVLDRLFQALGKAAYDAAYPVMRKACGFRVEMA